MSERSRFSRLFSKTRNVSEMAGIEGSIISGRDWETYQMEMGIRTNALAGEKVLNFGAGGSNIGQELNQLGINCRVVDADLKFDPYDNIKGLLIAPISLLLRGFNEPGKLRQKLVNLKRRIAGTEGRSIIQADGRALPFLDQSFDRVLASWSTYQIPQEAKAGVFKELMRVGRLIHIGPIFRKDYVLLSKIAPGCGFEIAACKLIDDYGFGTDSNSRFYFSSEQNNDRYIKNTPAGYRIKLPWQDDVKASWMFGIAWLASGTESGNTIVLRKKS